MQNLYKNKILLLILLALFSFSCVKNENPQDPNDPDPTPTKRIIKIGALLSLTGTWSNLGLNGKAALEIAASEINRYLAANGSDMEIKLYIEDTQLDPQKALQKLTMLRDSSVRVVIGPQSSAELNTIKSLANSDSILLISPSSTASSLSIANDNIFRLCPDGKLEGLATAMLMWADGKKALVSIARDDEGNLDLQTFTNSSFLNLGGTTWGRPTYPANASIFTNELTTIKSEILTLMSASHNYLASEIAVYAAGFDELKELFKAANNDSVFSQVTWYGGDGIAFSGALIADLQAALFASKVKFPSALFGVDESARDKWGPLSDSVRLKTGVFPDAFALAVYDAAWITALSYIAINKTTDFQALKKAVPNSANNYFGATGWTKLNDAGDRKYGNFDFWRVTYQLNAYIWQKYATYNASSNTIIRY